MSEPVLGPGTSSTTTLLAQVEAMPWSKRRRVSIVGSVVLSLVGVGCMMAGGALQYQRSIYNDSSPLGVVVLLLGVLMLLAAASTGRIAGRGPLVAGAVCGVLGVVALVSPRTVWSMADLFGIEALQLGVTGYAEVLLPGAAALLVGAGLSGRRSGDAAAADGAGPGSNSSGPIVEL